MKTLRTINTASSGSKNVGFRSLGEIENMLTQFRSDLDVVDETLDRLALATVDVFLDGKQQPNSKKNSVNQKKVALLAAPQLKELESNFSLVADLDEKIKSLDSMLAQLAFQFKDDKGHAAVVKEVKALRKDVEARIKKAYAAIKKVADGNVSKEFKDFCKEVSDTLIEQLDGAYSKSSQRLFIDTLNTDTLRFTHFIRFEELEDENGYVYKEYNVCLTHIVGPNDDSFHVNSIPVFRVPGRFNIGVEVESVEGTLDVIYNILISEGFRALLQGTDLPISEEDVDKSKFADIASKITVDPQFLEFTLRTGVNVDKAVNDLFVLVKGLVDGKTQGQQLRYKVTGKRIRFYMNSSKPIKLNRTQLKVMQHELGLSDRDVVRIMQEVL